MIYEKDGKTYERFTGINCPEELTGSSLDTFKFHSTFKAPIRMILRAISVPKDWSDGLVGNARVFWEWLEEYQALDKEGRRLGIIGKIIAFAIIIYFHDSNYREVFNWWLDKLMTEGPKKLWIPPHHKDPACWYSDETKRRDILGVEIRDDQIVSFDPTTGIVLITPLPDTVYWFRNNDHYYAVVGKEGKQIQGGFAYRILRDYGDSEHFTMVAMFGD